MTKSVLVPVADGSEEIEAVTIIDTLRRAGASVVVASTSASLEVVMSRKVKLLADMLLSEACKDDYDAIVLPVRCRACRVGEKGGMTNHHVGTVPLQ